MRFRIWHLLLFTLVCALALVSLERYSKRTVTLVVESIKPTDELYFYFDYEVLDGDSSTVDSGIATAKYGQSSIFSGLLTPKNSLDLVGTKVRVRYSYRDLLWMKSESLPERLRENFPDVIFWKTAKER